jgi:Amt family ammonium transporter
MVYSFVVTYVLGTIVHRTVGFRASRDAEAEGLDQTIHAETAYELLGVGGGTPVGRRASDTEAAHVRTATSEEGVNA